MWVVVVFAATLLLLTYSGFKYSLHHFSAPVVQQMEAFTNIGTDKDQH
jgi:type VI protein secretion system component VasF